MTKPLARPVPPAERSSQPTPASSVAPSAPAATGHPTDPITSATSPTTTRVRGGRRDKIRHPFEIYQDQLDTLRERAYHERREGKTGSMSQMVRDALGSYLSKHSPADD